METIIKLHIKTLKSGQERKFGDTINHYIITDQSKPMLSGHQVKDFCTGVLKKAYPQDKRPDQFSAVIVDFKEVAIGVYEYRCEAPYMG